MRRVEKGLLGIKLAFPLAAFRFLLASKIDAASTQRHRGMGEYTEDFRPVKRRPAKFLDRVIGRKPTLGPAL